MQQDQSNMDGFEATSQIRKNERARDRHTPIVAVTAYALEKDKDECLAAGMDAYITKPVDFKNVLRRSIP